MHQRGLLFVIDPRPCQIRLAQAVALFQSAQAKAALSEVELWRAQQLKKTNFGTAESVDTRAADQRSNKPAIDTAKAAIKGAQLDLEFSRVTAPFTGRIGAHLVSIGSLVSGSRGGASATTPLATIVSLLSLAKVARQCGEWKPPVGRVTNLNRSPRSPTSTL